MKKITSLLLCLMLVLSMALPAAAFSTGVTMQSGVVTLTLGADAAANARMTVEFDPNYLTYLDYETDFTVHSVREEDGRLEIGLANASSQKLQELVVIRFRVTGAWDQTRISVTTERVDGENGSGTYTSYLYGEGYYSGNETKVVLTAVKKQQLAELKRMVVEIDTDAFIIVQEAHQVLGDGFSRYTKDSL